MFVIIVFTTKVIVCCSLDIITPFYGFLGLLVYAQATAAMDAA